MVVTAEDGGNVSRDRGAQQSAQDQRREQSVPEIVQQDAQQDAQQAAQQDAQRDAQHDAHVDLDVGQREVDPGADTADAQQGEAVLAIATLARVLRKARTTTVGVLRPLDELVSFAEQLFLVLTVGVFVLYAGEAARVAQGSLDQV